MLAGVDIKHEGDKGAFELCSIAPVDGEAGAGDLRCAFEVENAELHAELPVGFGLEAEGGDGSPLFDFDVAALVGADGDFVAGEIGNAGEDGAQLFFRLVGGGFELVHAGFQGAGFFHHSARVLTGLLQPRDFLGEFIALRFQLLGFGDAFPAAVIEPAKISQEGGGILAAVAEFFLY